MIIINNSTMPRKKNKDKDHDRYIQKYIKKD